MTLTNIALFVLLQWACHGHGMTTDISMVRWDPSQVPGQEMIDDYEYDGGNSSSRLFERSRIKALAGKLSIFLDTYLIFCNIIKYKYKFIYMYCVRSHPQ